MADRAAHRRTRRKDVGRPAEAPAPAAPTFRRAVAAPLLKVWICVLAPASLIAAADALAPFTRKVGAVFFLEQDALVAALGSAVLAALFFVRPLPARWRPAIPDRRLVPGLALGAALFALAGVWLVFQAYPLSMDEYVTAFGARIFRAGRLAAPVPAEWRPYVPALQPLFVIATPGNAWWTAGYLPVNTAFLALAQSVGLGPLLAPLWAALAVVATWAVGRRLWPERPAIALGAVLLLATSAQLLFTAMTVYAMSAHLALDMVWLWLFLRGDRAGHVGAVAVGFLAGGLHQLVFHPLFAGPFILELWLARRWRSALWYTAAYAAICLFWISWWPLVLPAGASAAAAAAQPSAVGGFFAHVFDLLGRLDVRAPLFMAENLVRLFTWQSLLAAPLAVLALVPALKSRGPLRALALGPLLMLALCFLLLPFQGHGWGYRYLHGFLGSLCLLAAWSWSRMTGALSDHGRALARAAFAAAIAVSVLLLPLRMWQVARFVGPYAAAGRAIQASKARVVIVDTLGVWYGFDLVRNDPLFERGPVVLPLALLEPDQLRTLCAQRGVAAGVGVFGEAQARAVGVRHDIRPRPVDVQHTPALRAVLHRDCGVPTNERR